MFKPHPVTAIQWCLLAIALGLASFAILQVVSVPVARAQGPGGVGGRGFGPPAEQQVVDQFDRNKDTRLDAEERKAAREWLAANRTGPRGVGRGGMRGGMRGGIAAGTPGRALSPADVRQYGDEPLYDLQTLRTIFLLFDAPDWEQELATFHNTDVEVPATAIVDGRIYKDVGVHFRGASSFMMVPEGSKRSLNLSFDFVNDDQNLYGYRTLNLLNGSSDPTFLRPVLYAEIARSYIPAPKTNFVRVVINGESWGIYVSAQQYNKDFLRDFYNTDQGARWKVPGSPGGRGGMEYLGDDAGAYKRIYEIKSKDEPKAWADLIRMFKVLNEAPLERLEAELSPLLDIDGVLKFLAVEMALVNSDGYWTRASDYSIYQDVSGQFHVVPHDMNEGLLAEGGGRGFGPRAAPPSAAAPPPPDDLVRPEGGPVVLPFPPPPGGRGGRGGFMRPGVDLDPLIGLDDTSKPLRSKLLAVPALRQRYLAYVRDIAERWLDWNRLGPMLTAQRELIAEEVKFDTRKLYSYEAFQAGLDGGENSLRSFVERRRQYLLNVTNPEAGMK